MKSRAQRGIGILAIVLLSAFATVQVVTSQADPVYQNQNILQFQTMIGNDPDQTINGIHADDLPWDIYSADGTMSIHGDINLTIHGLVFANDPSVPPYLRGTNDEPYFRAVLSCLSLDQNGHLAVANITTRKFPATKSGNCHIHDRIKLPNPCIAPALFVIGADGKWFAATGAGK